ncbi:hypothetical protein ACLI09_01895 [Flavobacterium sp. RHBU_24]|uniref:hypothetical protein n=1 Tax=Flavobacterium sp. RHBU_24 TaxID=3391185 RepID=UPI0039848474
MNENNYNYLKDQVKYTGFGDALEADLKQNIEQKKETFTLNHDAFYGDDRVSATLNFKKSDQSDMYFFNSYDVRLEKEGRPETLDQTFYINKGSNITLKEAYNLMEGRSVNKDLTSKEGQEYNAWVQLDFKDSDSNGNFRLNHYHENYGYNLEAALSKYPLKELQNESHKQDLINSLKKGNLQSVTFIKDGKEVKNYIEANPQFKSITFYDSSKNRLDSSQSKVEKESQLQGRSEKAKQSTAAKNSDAENDAPGDDAPKKQRRKSQKM